MYNNYDCLLGNHEKMFLEYSPILENDRKNPSLANWLFKNGGEQTLSSYTSKEEFYKQLDFLRLLPLYIEYKDYKTKDGRYFNEVNIKRFETQVLWSRYKDFDDSKIFNVYGHTIFEEPVINEYISAIVGCYQSKEKISNPRLCVLVFPSIKNYKSLQYIM